MKRFTILLSAFLTSSVVFAQKPALPMRDVTRQQSIDLQKHNILEVTDQGHQTVTHSSGLRTLSFVQLGNAANALTVYSNATNVVSTNAAHNTVCFIHRNDPDQTGNGTSSQYNYDISKDGGFNFNLNLGPLNPNTPGANEGSINGRYPQGVLFNPSGANVADSQYLAYLGTWHNGDPTGPLNTWEGSITGVGRVDGSVNTLTESDDSVNHGNVGIFSGMCQSATGIFWAITQQTDGDDLGSALNDSSYVLLKGVWNSTTRDVDWSISTIIKLQPDLSYDGNLYDVAPQIAFDPSGQKGWIVLNGDFINDGNYFYQPVFIATTDGGDTWSAPEYVDLTTFPSIISILDLDNGSGIPTTGFDADLVVDGYGNPHYVIVIGSGSTTQAYAIESGLSHHIFDITRFGDVYEARDLSPLYTFRGFVGFDVNNPPDANSEGYTEDTRCQATTTPDGKLIFFSWIETDSTYIDPYNQWGYTNDYPNLWVVGEDPSNGFVSTPINVTAGTDFDITSYMPMMAPTCLRTTANDGSVLPITVLKVNEDGYFTSPASFFYLNNVTVNDADLVGVSPVSNPTFTVDQNYPNPFTSQTQIKVTLDKASNVNLKITNVLGQEVASKDYSFSSGSHNIVLNKGDFTSGVYNFTVTASGQQISKTMIVE